MFIPAIEDEIDIDEEMDGDIDEDLEDLYDIEEDENDLEVGFMTVEVLIFFLPSSLFEIANVYK